MKAVHLNFNLDNFQQSIAAKKFLETELHAREIGIYIFGAGEGGQIVLKGLKQNNSEYGRYTIKGIFDNNATRHGKCLEDILIMSPSLEAVGTDDYVLLTSLSSYREMHIQLLEMGVNKDHIIPPAGWLEILSDDQDDWLLPDDQAKTNELLLRKVVGRVCRSESQGAQEYIIQAINKKGLLIPLDFEYTVKHTRPDYVYDEVRKLIDKNIDAILTFYNKIKPYFLSGKFNEVTREKKNEVDPYWNNGFFSSGDARALYGIIAAYQPRLVIEVGVGNSTKFARKAIKDYGLQTKIISIDPEPRADIQIISDVIVSKNILDLDYDILATLKENDIFFIDGSHLAHCGTDVVHHFLNILPKIPAGVLVHFHDIYLPYEYLFENRIRHYNEQHILAAMLLYSQQWEIVLPIYSMYLQKQIDFGGVSFWIRKVG